MIPVHLGSRSGEIVFWAVYVSIRLGFLDCFAAGTDDKANR